MYNNLIYFLLVLLIYTVRDTAGEPLMPWWDALGLIILLFILYWALARALFTRLVNRLSSGATSSATRLYHRLAGWLSVMALVLFAVDVYVFGLKELVMALPLLKHSSALSGLVGLACFALFLTGLWSESYRIYTRIFQSRLSRPQFVKSQLRFNLPIILPYLLISALWDIVALLPRGDLKNWLDSPIGSIVFILLFLVALTICFPILIRPLWGLTPLPSGSIRSTIEAFCRRTGFTYREIMLWPLYEGEAMTAGVMGLVRKWRYILITKSLLRILTPAELEAVLGHELGHVRRKHLFFYFLFIIGFLLITIAIQPYLNYLFSFSDWTFSILVAAEDNINTVTALLYILPMGLVLILYFRFVIGAFIRNFERQADLFAYRLTGSIRGLVGSLEKIAKHSGQSRSLPSWHHYSVAQRVDFLERTERHPELIQQHERKIKRMAAGYVLVLALVGLGGYAIQQYVLPDMTISNEQLNRRIHFLEVQARENPLNAEAQYYLGGAYFQVDRLDEAKAVFERAVRLKPNDPEMLNSLAWTLAVREDVSDRDKSKALALARQAAEIKEASHILDTLAEALYLNGRVEEAVQTIERAIDLAGPHDDPQYLRRQKTKFLEALK